MDERKTTAADFRFFLWSCAVSPVDMKVFSTVLLFLALSFNVFSQASVAMPTNPQLIVLENKWRADTQNRALERDIVQETWDREREEERRRRTERANQILRELEAPSRDTSGSTPINGPSRSEPTMIYTYELKLRNESKKEVVSIVWEYLFLESDSDQEVGRRRFESEVSIKPGKTKGVSVRSSIPPTGTINAVNADAKKSSETFKEKIVIVAVKYTDGSAWPK